MRSIANNSVDVLVGHANYLTFFPRDCIILCTTGKLPEQEERKSKKVRSSHDDRQGSLKPPVFYTLHGSVVSACSCIHGCESLALPL